jgi:hypothetical protein
LWQSFAENFYPIRADMTRSRYISEEFASYLMTGRPVLAHRELANALSSILRPRDMQWFAPKTGNEAVNQDRNCKAWLEQVGQVMRRVMYDRASQFTRATKEGDADYVLFGQCVIEPRLNQARTGMLYRTWHLRDCVWAENADLVIDQFHRKWKLDARALCRLFPDTVSPEVKIRAEKDPFTEINCRVIVLPADEYDLVRKDEDKPSTPHAGIHPFVQIVIDEDHQTILEETPRPDLGYVIPRWVTIGGFSQYAYSPTAISVSSTPARTGSFATQAIFPRCCCCPAWRCRWGRSGPLHRLHSRRCSWSCEPHWKIGCCGPSLRDTKTIPAGCGGG